MGNILGYFGWKSEEPTPTLEELVVRKREQTAAWEKSKPVRDARLCAELSAKLDKLLAPEGDVYERYTRLVVMAVKRSEQHTTVPAFEVDRAYHKYVECKIGHATDLRIETPDDAIADSTVQDAIRRFADGLRAQNPKLKISEKLVKVCRGPWQELAIDVSWE